MAIDFSAAYKDALISDCGRYRYWLSRTWDETRPHMVFVMLNPSVADANIDDPTIRRCMGFAARENCGGIIVVNMFAYRATKPTELVGLDDPCGPENDDWQYYHISRACSAGVPVVLAWGANEMAAKEAKRFFAYYQPAEWHEFCCLGQTQSGAPKHPLYIAADQPLVPYVAPSF